MNVVVIGWGSDGQGPSAAVREMLGGARRLADASGGQVIAGALGAAARAAQGMIAHGADRVLTVEHEALAEPDADAYVAAAEAVVR